MLQNIPLMLDMTGAVVKAVNTPVTVKTRLGWNSDSLVITTLAEQLPGLRHTGVDHTWPHKGADVHR